MYWLVWERVGCIILTRMARYLVCLSLFKLSDVERFGMSFARACDFVLDMKGVYLGCGDRWS